MNKICLLLLIGLVAISCKSTIDQEMLDSVYKVYIDNRAMHRYGGIERHTITNAEEIEALYTELLSLKEKNSLPTKPFTGSILIRFVKKSKYGDKVINLLTTRIIFKPEGKYSIAYSQGQFVSDSFLKRVTEYVHIDVFDKHTL